MILTNNLFDPILIDPANSGGNSLYIISGYGTSAMAFHHLKILEKINKTARVELILGMCSQDGLSISNHRGFQQLMKDFPKVFKCGYFIEKPPIHSKIYIWCKDNQPFCGFLGSANYSQQAFDDKIQKNCMINCDPEKSIKYYDGLCKNAVSCMDPRSDRFINIYKKKIRQRLKTEKLTDIEVKGKEILTGLPHVRVSLLNFRNELSQRSGLNWGQRDRREPNQAYIPLNADICRSGFFPARSVHFTINTDDGRVLIATRAQDNGKAIETPHNNSLIGKYIRSRLGVSPGQAVNKDDLLKYGRTDVDFYKIEDETYFMDFSKPKK